MTDREQVLFNRAVRLIMSEWGKTREKVLEWLNRDDDGCWAEDTDDI